MSETDDDFFAGKRPWSVIKDQVLKSYIAPYIAKVSRLGRPILLIDGFSSTSILLDLKDANSLFWNHS